MRNGLFSLLLLLLLVAGSVSAQESQPPAPTQVQCSTACTVTIEHTHKHELVESSNFEGLGVTPTSVLYVYTWGLGAVLALWALGFAVGSAVTVLRKL